MDKEFMRWFVAERAKALAGVLLTRREDLVVQEAKAENGLDFLVTIKTEDAPPNRQFGVYVMGAMKPVTLEAAGKQLHPVVKQVRSLGSFSFPVTVFFFTVKENQGFYAWAYEPVVPLEGSPKLSTGATMPAHLDNESLEKIVVVVNRWYDSLVSSNTPANTSTSSTSGLPFVAGNPA